ncbi:acetyltransferaseGNAT family protein [Aphelenchoides avenae]|nr:acetyltransferaseGNAT family protein [Aphelenchus avenae]
MPPSTETAAQSGVESARKAVEGCHIDDDDQPKAPRCVGRCDIALGDVTQHNIMQLKRLNQSVFPISYNEKFYKEVVGSGELAKLAYFNDIVVGGVACRVDEKDGHKSLYIMTLGTLAPYRRFGIGTMLLKHVFSLCDKDPQIKAVTLHVQTNNESAVEFYKNFGFTVVGTAQQYYKRIEPDDAFILEKAVNQRNSK